jgi:hypothetical protein
LILTTVAGRGRMASRAALESEPPPNSSGWIVEAFSSDPYARRRVRLMGARSLSKIPATKLARLPTEGFSDQRLVLLSHMRTPAPVRAGSERNAAETSEFDYADHFPEVNR